MKNEIKNTNAEKQTWETPNLVDLDSKKTESGTTTSGNQEDDVYWS